MLSKITGGETELLFSAKILGKYDVRYFRCKETGFIQTEEPYWLEEAYSSAITKLDVGLVMRNENLVKVAVPLFQQFFNHQAQFLDYAGGYGLFTRMMRDRGFDFYHTDPYCQNLFAEFHDLKYRSAEQKFEAVTAFEVLEHLASPQEEMGKILAYSDNLFFTTEIVPDDLASLQSWWYLSLETGQHISFYTVKALETLANQLSLHYYTDGRWLHLFTSKAFTENPFDLLSRKVREAFFLRKMRKYVRRHDEKNNLVKESLMGHDLEEVKKRLRRGGNPGQ